MTSSPRPTTEELLAFARELADAADKVTMRQYRRDPVVWQKPDGSLVTVADTETESLLRQRITSRFPGHVVLGEEEGLTRPPMAMDPRVEPAPPVEWVLDPIDGTHNFVRGIPVWATLIACQREGRVEIGVASAPALGTRWWAARGMGAWRQQAGGQAERIAVSSRSQLAEAQVLFDASEDTRDAWGPGLDRLLRGSWRQRGFGDFWHYCLVAEGAAEVAVEAGIKAWDIAAPLIILEEAGGRLTDIEGVARLDAGHAIASNGVLHDQVLRVLRG